MRNILMTSIASLALVIGFGTVAHADGMGGTFSSSGYNTGALSVTGNLATGALNSNTGASFGQMGSQSITNTQAVNGGFAAAGGTDFSGGIEGGSATASFNQNPNGVTTGATQTLGGASFSGGNSFSTATKGASANNGGLAETTFAGSSAGNSNFQVGGISGNVAFGTASGNTFSVKPNHRDFNQPR